MKIDLHIHTSCSDGVLPVEEVFREAKQRGIDLMSLTDHDNVDCQVKAVRLAGEHRIDYIPGVELNVTFPHQGKDISLDFLGYRFDIRDRKLKDKLKLMREHRERRAHEIMEKVNLELDMEKRPKLTEEDFRKIEASVDGAFGRPHIARYLVEKRIVGSVQEAFDRYLVRCDVPKYPLSLSEASELVRKAGGVLALAHPNDFHGTSLFSVTKDLEKQTEIIEQNMLGYIDGIECWHSSHDAPAVAHYIVFARRKGLLMTGGSDCHQKPVSMGTLEIPDWVAGQFLPMR